MNKSYGILIKNLKEELRLRAWSQGTLGEKAGVSQERISYLLNGKTEPTLSLVDKLADALEMATVELLSDQKKRDTVIAEPFLTSYERPKKIVFTKYGKTSKVKNVSISIPNRNQFRAEFIEFNLDKKKPKSGKANSYANYMEYLLQNYFDNFGEILNPLHENTLSKLEELQSSPNFRQYNLSEKRFPNATMGAYKRFMNTIK